ncbi:MAG: hypothetical protein Q9195_000884 [Heterodermia aff. obscurata]
MIYKDLRFSVNIRAGVNGPVLPEYDSERSRTTRSIEAVTDTVLCTQVTIHKNFEWYDADGLYVAIRYGSRDYQIELWIPKPDASQLGDEDDWTIQIPGKNILDAATNRNTGCQYRFAELETWQCNESSGEGCLDYKQGNERYLGTIWVSIKRRKVKHGLAPTSANDNKASKPPLKMCKHSSAIQHEGVKHTVKRERVAPFEMGSVIPNPKQDGMIDLDTGKQHGHFMNTVFLFRAKEQLSKVIEGQVKSDSSKPGAGGSTEPFDVLYPDKNVAASKASKNTSASNPVLTKASSKKRRRAEADGNAVVETDSSLNAGTSKHHEPKKNKKETATSEKADLNPVGLSFPAAANPKAQENARLTLLHQFKQKPNKGAKPAEDASQAGLAKETLRSRGSDPMPEPPLRLGRSSTPKFGDVIEEDNRKLAAAEKARRRTKPKHARVSSQSPTRRDQSAATSAAPVPEKTRAQPISKFKKARVSRSTSSSSDPDESSLPDSSIDPVPEKAVRGREPRNSTQSSLIGIDRETPLRNVDLDAKDATSEQEIQVLRDRKERLRQQLKQKLKAECEELERQLKE